MMRNIPFPFLLEETLESISERAQSVGRQQNNRPVSAVRLSRREMEKNWPEIAEHKWLLSERIGRDVGSEVAALDYAENIQRLAEQNADGRKVAVRGWSKKAGKIFDACLDSTGMHSFANAQKIIRGVPNSGWPMTPVSAAKPVRPHAAGPVHIPASLIACFAREIQEHKWFLSERLGRDAGIKVAALDYLRNIKGVKGEGFFGRTLRFLDKLMTASGPNSIANLERAMGSRMMNPIR